MNENWVMLCIGVVLVMLGVALTGVSGPMPGVKTAVSTATPISTKLDLRWGVDVRSWSGLTDPQKGACE
jgi:hypothetical protein